MSNDYVELLKRGNRAVHVNPARNVDEHLTESGSDWLWTCYSIFGFLAITYAIFFFYYEMRQDAYKIQRYTIAAPFIICLIEFFNYFTYASNLGWGGIQAEFRGEDVSNSVTNEYPNVRQVFYCKYIAWVLCWPIVLYLNEMASLCSSSGENITFFFWDIIHSLLIQIIGTVYWVVCILIGILIHSTYKWGYWVFGTVVLIFIECLKLKRQVWDHHIRGLQLCMFLTQSICVLLYLVAWGLSEGGNAITVTGAVVFYGILDLCVFAIWPGYLLYVIMRFDAIPTVSGTSPRPYQNDQERNIGSGNALSIPPRPTNDAASEYDGLNEKTSPSTPRASGDTAIAHNDTDIEESDTEEGESRKAANTNPDAESSASATVDE